MDLHFLCLCMCVCVFCVYLCHFVWVKSDFIKSLNLLRVPTHTLFINLIRIGWKRKVLEEKERERKLKEAPELEKKVSGRALQCIVYGEYLAPFPT